MRYERIINYVASAIWSMHDTKMSELLSVLAFRAAGGDFTAEEIKARIGEPEPPEQKTQGAVAVIPLRGVIAHRMGTMEESSGGMSAERFTRMVKAATADPSISAILLDVDSPGGTINGVSEAADAVHAAGKVKQVVALANGYMASAAYWIASQAHEIVAVPSLLDRSIGSIGVFTVHQDLSAYLEKEGIKVSLIKAGKHKAEANPFEPLSDETRASMQTAVDEAYGNFVRTVARGRGVGVDDVRKGYGQGRALNAQDALAAGMIDKIASFDDTLKRLTGRKGTVVGARAEEETPAIVAQETDADADRERRYRYL